MSSGAKKGAAEKPGDLGALSPDEWPEGLKIGFRTLSAKRVARARQASEVVAVCARHNLRLNNAGHRHRSRIDPARTPLNWVMEGERCPEAVAASAAGILAGFGLTYSGRIDAVAAFEVVIQPPPGWDGPEFWGAAMEWASTTFEHVISAVVHRDQSRPHGHILVLPVLSGRLCGRDMQRGSFGVPHLRLAFYAHIRAVLGLREGRSDVLTRLALSAGRGPKKHAEAARRDADFVRRAGVPGLGLDIDGLGHSALPQRATSKPSTSRIAQPFHAPNRVANDRDFDWMMSL
jgi:hypothetical protein